MNDKFFSLDINDYPVGKCIVESVDFPSFYGLQDVNVPLYVYRATKKVSPCIVVTACMHGDEINGMRIAQSIIQSKLKLIKGTLIILPVINIYGFMNKVRYLPDRRDLNRCFPGSEKGSFGARFANFIFKNITRYGDIFIDLHSAGSGRYNIPQIRIDLESQNLDDLVDQIRVPLIINSSLRDGSLRGSIDDLGKVCIVFEGGEGLRIDENISKYGIDLVKSVLRYKGMLKKTVKKDSPKIILNKTQWYRAHEGGVFLNKVKPGKVLTKGHVLGELRSITGELISCITLKNDGVVIGIGKSSVVMAGDALYNIGYMNDKDIIDDEILDYFDYDSLS